jgi:hypothetical protein
MTTPLHRLLDRNLALPAEYAHGMTNHLPMALHALHALGAGAPQLERFFAAYARRFEGGRAGCADPAGFAEARAVFDARIAEHGSDAVVAEALPRLWPGVAGAAFHGLIRTAHAVQAGHAGELAAALAYWAVRAQAVPEAGPPSSPMPLAAWTGELEAAALQARFPGSSISGRMAHAVASPAYQRLAAALAPEDATLERLAGWAARLYARSGNFTVLHTVTGLRAARVLMARWPAPAGTGPVLVRALTAALLASHLATNTARAPLRSWAEVRAAALASDDDHAVKLVHACVEETAAYGEGERLAAASRVLA